jgi:catechol 2,3-dioxygenase
MTNEPYGIAAPGYRLPQAARPGPVRLQVADLHRSLDWYGEVLGLPTAALEEGKAVLGASDHLVELRELSGARPAPRRGRLGLFHFAILLPDRADLGALARHLMATGTPFGASDHLVSEALYLRDPDGLGIEVYADRPRQAWRARASGQTRELVMATEPLALDGLVAAADGAGWNGMPAGAVMGHVHLHVGDLAAARSFYHGGLGLDLMVWSYPGALFLSAGGYHHHLAVNTWAGADAARPTPADARLLEWTLLVPDDESLASVERSLAEAHGVAARDGGLGFVVSDPWGTSLRIRVSA